MAFGVSRKTERHGVVLIAIASQGDFGYIARSVGTVVGGIFRRLIIDAGIDAKDGKVARMTRPHPVVRISAEFAYRTGRRKNHAYVAKYFVYDEIKLIVTVKRDHFGRQKFIRTNGIANDRADGVGDPDAPVFVFNTGQGRQDTVTYVDGLLQVSHGQIGHRQFFRHALRNKPIREVVMCDTAQLLNSAESTMVVGENQSFFRDGDARTSPAKNNYCIGYAWRGIAVQPIKRRVKSQFLHSCQIAFI